MLVLTRHTEERIRIGRSIVVMVCQAFAGMARIGIDAPRDLPVHREELYRAILQSDPHRLPRDVSVVIPNAKALPANLFEPGDLAGSTHGIGWVAKIGHGAIRVTTSDGDEFAIDLRRIIDQLVRSRGESAAFSQTQRGA